MKRRLVAVLAALAVCLLMGWYGQDAAPTLPPGSAPTPELAVVSTPEAATVPFDLDRLPPFQGAAWVEVNDNSPYFTPEEQADARAFERYAPLDALGRCGPAYACVGEELMPTEPRGAIGAIRPTGWHTVRYDDLVEGKYLYNRCHLLGYQLTGENDNPENLITGTRFLNIRGMQPFENQVASYIRRTGNHVLCRVTPVFRGDDLLAAGVLMEGLSVEDQGAGVRFCVFAYNVQPGVWIDYATGQSARADEMPQSEPSPQNPDA